MINLGVVFYNGILFLQIGKDFTGMTLVISETTLALIILYWFFQPHYAGVIPTR